MKEYEDNPRSIKYHVKQYLLRHKNRFSDKIVIDLPAGNGVTSNILKNIGAHPLAFDLFPEYFKVEGIKCERANVLDKIPCASKVADYVICQEGIEHFTDQFKALREFNRVLKLNGSLIITTPNYSNLRARLSYFLSESERFNSIMPPNEIDSIWMNDQNISGEIYFGHVFLTGIQKLRVLAKLSGFKIKHIQFTRLKTTSLLIFIFTYPFIVLSSLVSYLKNVNKDKGYDKQYQKEVYLEIFKLNINPNILLDGHLFVEFEKVNDHEKVMNDLKSVHKEFGTT
ncbi:MAG TPA: methyltransferase domain-containing protein [Bacteroidia bacterium]|nr:methyltransferase domain-containing protein [Bacteroidia bacterium]HNS13258.1 methyltransferase domain-containing protein [Bacteroidia bacterium]